MGPLGGAGAAQPEPRPTASALTCHSLPGRVLSSIFDDGLARFRSTYYLPLSSVDGSAVASHTMVSAPFSGLRRNGAAPL